MMYNIQPRMKAFFSVGQHTGALLLLLGFLLLAAVPVAANPFTGSGSEDRGSESRTETDAAVEDGQTESRPAESAEGGAAGNDNARVLQSVRRLTTIFPARVQRDFNQRLSGLMDSEDNSSGRTLLLIAAIALLYGLVHAALPGHRKTLLLSYFLASDSRPYHAVVAGAATAFLHAAAGAAVVLSAWFLLQVSVSAAVDSATVVVQRITAIAAASVGVLILWSKLRERFAHGHSHCHSDDKPPGRIATWLSGGRMLPAIVISATVPCPGSSMILLFALAVGNLTIGLLAVSMFAVGMGTTLIVVGLIAVMGKRQLIQRMNGKIGHALHEWLEIAAAVAIIAFGVFWLFASTAAY